MQDESLGGWRLMNQMNPTSVDLEKLWKNAGRTVQVDRSMDRSIEQMKLCEDESYGENAGRTVQIDGWIDGSSR
jgi:hypothetical protein